MNENTAEIDALLGNHEYRLGLSTGSICDCGYVPPRQPELLRSQQDWHRLHLGELLTERMAQAWDEGFTRGFYDVLAAGPFDASESEAVNPYEPTSSPGGAA